MASEIICKINYKKVNLFTCKQEIRQCSQRWDELQVKGFQKKTILPEQNLLGLITLSN